MNDTNIQKNIKEAFALLENAVLDDNQMAEIMHRAANPRRAINRVLLFAAATAPLIAAAAALALCIFFSQAGGDNSLHIFFAGRRRQFRTARAHSRQYRDDSCGVFQPRKTGNPQWRAPNNINYRLGVGKFHPRGNISHKSLAIFSRPWRRPSKRALWLIRRWNQL